jgi:hypothetical protein
VKGSQALFPKSFAKRGLWTIIVALQERSNMRSFTPKWCTTWLASLAAMLALTLLATPSRTLGQDQPPYQDQQGNDQDDPPTRAARLSYTGGSVSFAPAGTDEWVNAVVNRPMTTGDKLWTDQGARAELRVDSYAIRLGEQTGFSFLNLDDRTVQIRLTEGSVNVRVRRLDQDQVLEIDTPNLAFNVLRPGSYRVSVNENGDATIINVRDGQGEVTGGGSAYPIRAGQSATFEGTDQLSADVEGYPGDDDFDRWCGDRDSRWDRSQSARYVSDDVVGYEDLDDYGGWRSTPDYGTVWFPHTTVVGWAPYRYGHWVWVSPWGWTWVDDAPWGFAPFHYGRWVVVGGVWGWVPVAPRPAVVTVAYVRPVYAPALVAWVGGPRFGVGVAVGGGVAWFPLGPRDVYCPSYHVTERYVERVNVYNTTIINRVQVTNVYRNVYVNKNVTNITYQNQRYGNAVTATSRESFTSAQPVGRNMMRVDAREVTTAQVSPMTPGVAPQQRSFLGSSQQARVRPPANVVARPVVAKTAPPPPVAPVDRQLQQVQANGGRPVAVSQIRQNNVPRNNVRVAQEARPAQLPPQGQRVNNRPGQPNQPQAQPNNNRPGQQNQPPAQAQQNNNRPVQQNQLPTQVQPNNNRPAQQAQPPAQTQPNNNRPNAQPNQPPQAQPDNRGNNNRNFNDRPPTSRPTVNPQVEQRQQQQLDKLRQQQDQERQKLEQKQVQQNQKIEQQQNQQRQQQEQQRQQQQLEQMERKHDQQQQKMQQRQQQEVQKQQRQAQPPKQDKPPKQEKPPNSDNKDRPH